MLVRFSNDRYMWSPYCKIVPEGVKVLETHRGEEVFAISFSLYAV
jgi:hypothetical protein